MTETGLSDDELNVIELRCGAATLAHGIFDTLTTTMP